MRDSGLNPNVMMSFKSLFTTGVVFAVMGCSPSARLETGHSGDAPLPAGIVVVTDASVPPHFTATVIESLNAQGFPLAERPAYRLQLSVSQMRGRTGLFAPDELEEAGRKWIMKPARARSATTVRATMRLTDAMTGRELFRAYANERSRAEAADLSKGLADALVIQLQQPLSDLGPARSAEAE
ncbi:hypothetical protein M2333_002666 [Sphingobium sp. B11D3B]|uniref:hypothetical protein n=1 Tax=Sphingobium sp. B11D3B TaxID=2940575 RepID=UPI0022268342|nr:hypothetical protein [Sphingobium sp. B11D3B]MCW2389620.1 hypothetical protein [Sphingobium sp. B11D3B]